MPQLDPFTAKRGSLKPTNTPRSTYKPMMSRISTMHRKETVLALPFWLSRADEGRSSRAGSQIQKAEVNYYKPFMWSVIAVGFSVVGWGVYQLPAQALDRRFLFLAIVTVFVGSRIGIEFSRHKI